MKNETYTPSNAALAYGPAYVVCDPKLYKYLFGKLKRVVAPMAHAIYGAMHHTGKVKQNKNDIHI